MSELACPECGAIKGDLLGHVENDRIAWWECLKCKFRWPR